MFAGCQNKELDIREVLSKPFVATTEDYSAAAEIQTKTSLDEYGNVLWKQGDQVSIFAGSTINEQYQVTDASDGQTSAALNRVSSPGFVAGGEIANNVAFYPYATFNTIAKNGSNYVISTTLPSIQSYAESSFGNGSFPMATVTSTTSDYNLKFKNVLGGLKLQLKGTATIASISVSGNNDEVLCGAVRVTVSNTAVPSINLTDGSATTVTLDCGTGVQLNSATATDFVIALPPMTMAGGFTVTVTDTEGKQMEIKTTRSQTITRSNLLKMPVVKYVGVVVQPNNIIYYTTTDKKTISTQSSAFNVSIISNDYKDGVGVITFDGPVTTIKSTALYCNNLFSLCLPGSVTSIDPRALYGTSYNLTRFEGTLASDDGRCLVLNGKLIAFAPNGLEEYTTPSGVTSIGGYAFSRVEWTTPSSSNINFVSHITLSEGVTAIEAKAFAGSWSKTHVYLPSTLKTIDADGFYDSNSHPITIPAGVETIDVRIFEKKVVDILSETPATLAGSTIGKQTYPIYVPKGSGDAYKAAWPGLATRIIEKLFDQPLNEIWFTTVGGSELRMNRPDPNIKTGFDSRILYQTNEKIVLEEPLLTVPSYYFQGSNLVSLSLPESVVTIDGHSIQLSASLEKVDLKEGLKYLEWACFDSCSSLESIDIPESVLCIDGAFMNCSNLKHVKLPSTLKYLGTTHYNTGTLLEADIHTGSCSVFENCGSLESIEIPRTLIYIGYNCFRNCKSLRSVDLPDGVSNILKGAFWGSGLEEIVIPAGISAIAEDSYGYCANLINVVIPENITSIEQYSFRGCKNLKSFTFPSHVTAIESSVFSNCGLLETVKFPKELKTISSSAFDGCKNLKEIYSYTMTPPSVDGSFNHADSGMLHVPAGADYDVFVSTYLNWWSSNHWTVEYDAE